MRVRSEQAPTFPALVLLHEDGSRELLTAQEVWNEATAAAARLRAAGLAAGGVVVLAMNLSRHLVANFIGAMTIGLVPTIVPTITPRLDVDVYRRRLAELVSSAAAAAVITDHADAAKL